jgi:deoxyadenosine/deoxycytidine kinase
MSAPKIIAVAGTMGAGKSSLVEWLRQQFGMVPFFEPNEENPYLADFYDDMRRWAFHSQMFFLIRRFQIHREIERRAAGEARRVRRAKARSVTPPPIVQDRTIYEDAEVFARHLHEAGHLDARDWATYQDMYQTLCREVRPPDLMIYLRCPLKALTRRIKRRGRAFEQALPRKYLASLERLYEEWFAAYSLSPTLVVETGSVDYVEHLFDRLELQRAIASHL